MSTVYADRAFVNVNGVDVLDLESFTLKQSDATKYVPTMTRNRRHKGVVKSNRDINISFAVAIQNALGSPKIEEINFESQDVSIGFEHGGDRYLCKSVSFVDVDQSAGGVGQEGKKAYNMLALDVVDQVGNSALFQTSLANA